jgi:hypothetical protein
MSAPDLLTPVIHKLAACIRLFSSDKVWEVEAAVSGIQRLLKGANDVHALADRIEKANGGGVTEADLKRVYDAGYAQGIQDAENRRHGGEDFLGADGKPTWEGVALFLQRNKSRLDNKHHEFVDDMASRTVWGREPTERQHKYMHSLFHKLGGKIT